MEKSINMGSNTEKPHMRSEETGVRPCRYSIPSPLEDFMKGSNSVSCLDGSDLSQNLIVRLLEIFSQEIVKVEGQLDEERKILVKKGYLEWVGDSHLRISERVNKDAIIEKRVKQPNDEIVKNLPRP